MLDKLLKLSLVLELEKFFESEFYCFKMGHSIPILLLIDKVRLIELCIGLILLLLLRRVLLTEAEIHSCWVCLIKDG